MILAKLIKYVMLGCHSGGSLSLSLVVSVLCGGKKSCPFFYVDSLTAARILVMPDESIYACGNQLDSSSSSLQ